MTITRFPVEQTIGRLSNDPRMEWLYACLDGHPNPSKKRLILLARSEEVAFIDDATAEILIDSLGLRGE